MIRLLKGSHARALGALFLGAGVIAISAGTALAQGEERARAILEQAADAMGGLDRLTNLDTLVMTGFGQRLFQEGGGNITGEVNAPPKWQSITDVQRSFDLANGRALNQERRSFLFPFAAEFGMNYARSDALQTGFALMDHPLPALLAALDGGAALGPVTTEDGDIVVQFTATDGVTAWIAVDPVTHLPAWTRWIRPSNTLGDVTHTALFSGYAPYDDVYLPLGLMNRMDWRDQITLMFQVDSYRIDVAADQLPAFPEPAAGGGGGGAAPEAQITEIAAGVWDIRVGTGGPFGGAGGPVIEFDDHLVMFEAYGNEAATLARIDAANALVPGKEVEAVIVTHHHFDHTGGLRAAVSRGLSVISHDGNEGIIAEILARPAVNFPDALARNPHPLEFIGVGDRLVLEDGTNRLEIYPVREHSHMAHAVFAYLPEAGVLMEGDLSDEAWGLHWWAGALGANIAHYGLEPEINVAVHGSGPMPFAEVLANSQAQAEAAADYCVRMEEGGRFILGCPVQYDTDGPLDLMPR